MTATVRWFVVALALAAGAIGIQHAKDHSFEVRKIEIREEK